MNATHTHNSTSDWADDWADQGHDTSAIDWVGQIKLALVLSVAATIVALGLAERVSETTLVVGVIVVSSAVAWSRVEPLQPARVQSRRR